MIAAVDEWAFNERPAGVRFLTGRIGEPVTGWWPPAV
jgi:hypothetical protein